MLFVYYWQPLLSMFRLQNADFKLYKYFIKVTVGQVQWSIVSSTMDHHEELLKLWATSKQRSYGCSFMAMVLIFGIYWWPIKISASIRDCLLWWHYATHRSMSIVQNGYCHFDRNHVSRSSVKRWSASVLDKTSINFSFLCTYIITSSTWLPLLDLCMKR